VRFCSSARNERRFYPNGDRSCQRTSHKVSVSLLFERRAPVLEETACPTLTLVAPELAKRLLEQVGSVQPLVGSQQHPQRLPPLQREVLLARRRRVFLALDEAPLLSRHARIPALSHLIAGFAPRWRMTWNLSDKMAARGTPIECVDPPEQAA
jgi:hypothetical protein